MFFIQLCAVGPFLILGIYCIRRGLTLSRTTKPAEVRKALAKSVWFWLGIVLLPAWLGVEIWVAAVAPQKSLQSERDQLTALVVVLGIPSLILGAYCLGRGLTQSRLTKRTWLWSGGALLCVGLVLPVILELLLSGAPGAAEYWWLVLLVSLGSSLPFIILGIYCIRRGFLEGRLPKPVAEKEKSAVAVAKPAETGKQHPVWFWLGLALFAGAEVTGCSVFISLAASGGRQPPAGNEAAFIISSLVIVLAVLLILLSRRKIRHGWFWPGTVMFIWGMGTIPMWVNVCLISNFPYVPYDAGGCAALIGVFCIPFIIGGTLCLWRGWPRTGVKHPQGERLSFILASTAISLMCSLLVVSPVNAPPNAGQKDILSFSDSFDDGVANAWKLDSGWQVKNDNGNYILAGKGQDYQWAWPQVSQASAYILEADFELLDYGSELRFNTMYSQGVGAPNRYIVGMLEGNGVYLAKEFVSNSKRDYASLDKREANITLKQWHHIKIAVGGNIIKVYLDDELKMEYWDESPFPSGSFTIETGENSFAYVDNITVKPNTEPIPKKADILSFTDSFDDGVADGWQLEPGWRVTRDNNNYVLEGQGSDFQRAWPRVSSAENYMLEADFMLVSGLFEFEVRHSESDKLFSDYKVWVYQDRVNLGKNVSKNLVDLGGSATDIGFKRWHTIRIALEKKNIKVYIDQELKIDYWDNEPLPAGSFRIMSHPGSQVRLDNILVKPYADSTWAPPPAPLPPPQPNSSK